jgi:uncharacterized protein YegL
MVNWYKKIKLILNQIFDFKIKMEHNHIIILIDCSYSMDSHLDNVVFGLNNFLKKLKEKYAYSENIYLTVVCFSTNIKYILEYKNINIINNFSRFDFQTWGSTALYDSICDVILKFKDFNSKTNLFIITDGDDNVSKIYSKQQTDDICNMAINSGLWNITHCHTDMNILNIPTIKYDIDDISNVFDMLKI